MHSLGIVQWNSTRRDHPENPGGVSGSGPVRSTMDPIDIVEPLSSTLMALVPYGTYEEDAPTVETS